MCPSWLTNSMPIRLFLGNWSNTFPASTRTASNRLRRTRSWRCVREKICWHPTLWTNLKSATVGPRRRKSFAKQPENWRHRQEWGQDEQDLRDKFFHRIKKNMAYGVNSRGAADDFSAQFLLFHFCIPFILFILSIPQSGLVIESGQDEQYLRDKFFHRIKKNMAYGVNSRGVADDFSAQFLLFHCCIPFILPIPRLWFCHRIWTEWTGF